MRVCGAKVGKRVFFDTAPPAELDNLSIGDDVTVLEGTQTLLPHVIDHGHLQFARIKIENSCTVGIQSVMLPFTTLRTGVSLDALTLVLKGQELVQNSHWTGTPAAPFDLNLAKRLAEQFEGIDLFNKPEHGLEHSEISDSDSCCIELDIEPDSIESRGERSKSETETTLEGLEPLVVPQSSQSRKGYGDSSQRQATERLPLLDRRGGAYGSTRN
jgi:hypothetical protein